MTGRIFLLDEHANLLPMDESPYDSERLLQELLAKYPDLLAGDQINSDAPRRWLLIRREMGIPGEEDGAERWSLDHLFLDQDAIPTLVEVKRSVDTRIRREVVGQMLDYAANAVAYWPVERVQAAFESRCEAERLDPTEELTEFLGEGCDCAGFWQLVKTNLQAGRIRMVFIADEIPSELRRIVEFLNSHLDPTEVLAIEVKRFVGEGRTTLVPRVVGMTESARRKPVASSSQRESITENEFLSEFDAKRSPAEREIARQLINWSRRKGLNDEFRRGRGNAVYIPCWRSHYPVLVDTDGTLRFRLKNLRNCPPFDHQVKRDEALTRLRGLPGLKATDAARDGFPTIPLIRLAEATVLDSTLNILDWIVEEIRTGPPC